MINSLLPWDLPLETEGGSGAQEKFISGKNCWPSLIAHIGDRWGWPPFSPVYRWGYWAISGEGGALVTFTSTGFSTTFPRGPCCFPLYIKVSALSGKNGNTADQVIIWKREKTKFPPAMQAGQWPWLGMLDIRNQPARRWVATREVNTCSVIAWFISSPQLVRWSGLCSFQPKECGAPPGAWLCSTDVQIFLACLMQAPSSQSQCSRAMKCLSCLLLWTWLLEESTVYPHQRWEHRNTICSRAALLLHDANWLKVHLVTGGREKKATEGFQILESSWTSVSKEHLERGGKSPLWFSWQDSIWLISFLGSCWGAVLILGSTWVITVNAESSGLLSLERTSSLC